MFVQSIDQQNALSKINCFNLVHFVRQYIECKKIVGMNNIKM